MNTVLQDRTSLSCSIAVFLFCATTLLSAGVCATERSEVISAVDPAVVESLREMTIDLEEETMTTPVGAPPGANIPLGGTNEPTIAVDPNNPLNICAVSLFSLRVSTDGGITFQPSVGAAVPATHGLCGDPSVGYDSQGRLFWTYLGCIIDMQGNITGIDVFIAQCSPATGAILPGYPVNITASAGVNLPASAGNFHDKEWLAIDFHPGSPYTDRLYVTWSDLTAASAIRTTFSTDQGMTWSPTLVLSGGGEGFVWPCHNTVAPNGDVYVAYHDQTTFAGGPPAAPDGVSGRVFVLRSTNGGGSFPQKTLPYDPGEADITFNRQASPNTIAGTQFWLQGSAQPFIMTDPNTPGRIYVVACDDPDDDHSSGDHANIYIATSTDYGVKWDTPKRVDDGPGTTFQVMPTAAIDPVTGCMVVHYYDNRSGATNADGRFLLDVFAHSSSDGGVTWSPGMQINDVPFDPDPGAPCRFGPLPNCGSPDPVVTTRIGEYNGVGVANGVGFAVWCGNTFSGATPTGQQMIFDRFAFDTEAPILDCPPDFSAECSAPGGTPRSEIAGQLIATAADQCDSDVDITDDGPDFFPGGVTTVTFTATDDAGNSNSCETDVTIVDTTPPDITCPADITVACNGPQGTYPDDPQLDPFWAGVSAADICDPDPVITNNAPGLFPIGTTPVVFKATDDHNNENTCVAKVTVKDIGIDIWLTDLIVNPGQNLLVPVYIQDVTGWDIMGFEIEICWCQYPAGLLQYEYCLPGEVMTNSGWLAPACNICDPACVSIAAAAAAPLVGEGVLFYLKFHVSTNAKPCMCCELWFDSAVIYDPEAPLFACWKNGSVCVEWCDVAGCINYWKCCPDDCGGYYYVYPLSGAQVHIRESCSGAHLATAFTGADGCYEFTCLDRLDQSCYYTVDVDYCQVPDCVNPMDAALILRYLACADNLDDCPFPYDGGIVYPQQVAADVTCSQGITGYDASLILQYFVGLIPAFPCYEPWVFYALGPNHNEVHQCPGTVDWVGVLIGDVSGCFECELMPAPLTGDAVNVALGVPVDLGDRIEVPVIVQGAYDILAGHFRFVYDAGELSVISAQATGIAAGSMTAHNAMGGDLIFAMAAGEAYGGDGEVALITFGKLHPDADASSVELTEAMFNDGLPPAEIGASASVPAEEGQTALGRAVPNPFTRGTVITYRMAAAGQVSIQIYNVSGQLVRTLASGATDGGHNSILWNGKDDSGRAVPGGIYFCRMETEDYQASEKIVFMK